MEDEDEDEDESALVHGRRKRKVAFMPSLGRVYFPCFGISLIIAARHDSHNLLPWSLAESKCSVVVVFSDVLGELILLSPLLKDNADKTIPGLWSRCFSQDQVKRLDFRLVRFNLHWFSVVARNNDILKKLVLEAKREYEKDAEHRVHIFMADT